MLLLHEWAGIAQKQAIVSLLLQGNNWRHYENCQEELEAHPVTYPNGTYGMLNGCLYAVNVTYLVLTM